MTADEDSIPPFPVPQPYEIAAEMAQVIGWGMAQLVLIHTNAIERQIKQLAEEWELEGIL